MAKVLTCEYKDCGVIREAEDMRTAFALMELHERSVHQVEKEVTKKEENKKKENKKEERKESSS